MIEKLQTKLQISVLLVFSLVSVVGIVPFIFIRYIQGNYLAAFIDLVLVTGILTLVYFAKRTGKPRIASAIIALFINAGIVAVIAANGVDSFLWIYPVLAVTFFLVKPFEALGISLVSGGIIASLPNIFDAIPLDSFLMTSLMLSLCAFFYANYGNKQLRLLARLNTTDPLIGALNRRALSADIEAALSRAERNGTEHLLALLDLDYFKKVNDKYGHGVGDEVLKNLVSITKLHIRKYDQIYRFGGEEFVLLVPDIKQQQQHTFIENLRETIQNKLKTPDGKAVTVSFGVASWTKGTTPDTWLKRADDALYQAKANGRNCAVFSDK